MRSEPKTEWGERGGGLRKGPGSLAWDISTTSEDKIISYPLAAAPLLPGSVPTW